MLSCWATDIERISSIVAVLSGLYEIRTRESRVVFKRIIVNTTWPERDPGYGGKM